MDLTSYLQSQPQSADEEPLLSVAINGRIALAMKGRFFLRCFCNSFSERARIGCAVTDEESCLNYFNKEPFELLLCTDLLEKGNGFELARKASERQKDLKIVVLALSDAIPVEYDNAPWLEAVVAEADIIEDRKPLEATVLAVMGHHCCRSPSHHGNMRFWTASPAACQIGKFPRISSSPKRQRVHTPNGCCAPSTSTKECRPFSKACAAGWFKSERINQPKWGW